MPGFVRQALSMQQIDHDALSDALKQLLVLTGRSQGPLPDQNWSTEQLLELTLNLLIVGDFRTRWEAAKLLPRWGTPIIAPLLELLQDEETDWELRWFAVRILGEIRSPEVVTDLVNVIKTSEQEELAAIASEALASFGLAALPALSELLAESAHRFVAVQALSRIRHPDTIDVLLSVVDDPDPAIRTTTVEALSSFHDERVISVLIQALQDRAAAVRREAVVGLGLQAGEIEGDLVPLLQPLLWDFNLEVCRKAAIALGRIQTEAAAAALAEGLRSPHTPLPLQLEIVQALSWISTPTALNALLDALQQGLQMDAPEVCREVVKALSNISAPALVSVASQHLVDLLQLPSSHVGISALKQSAALGLARLGQLEALAPLIQLLADPEEGVRLHAIAALKQLAPEAAHQQLQQMAQTELPPTLREGVELALREW